MLGVSRLSNAIGRFRRGCQATASSHRAPYLAALAYSAFEPPSPFAEQLLPWKLGKSCGRITANGRTPCAHQAFIGASSRLFLLQFSPGCARSMGRDQGMGNIKYFHASLLKIIQPVQVSCSRSQYVVSLLFPLLATAFTCS
jgi:hypothetical protein